MTNRTLRAILASCALLLALGAGSAQADETTFCNATITTLPYTISAQGHYCFDRNLSTAQTTGNAITINVDFVVLDLNNFKLGGGSAGLGTTAVGILANNRRNVTIRNGNIRGFKYAIRLLGTGGGHVVENNALDANTFVAVDAHGDLLVVNNNIISNTGGGTGTAWSYGILAAAPSTGVASVRDNVISNVFNDAAAGGGYSVGIVDADVVDHNVIKMGTTTGGGSSYGAWLVNVCRDNTVLAANTALSCSLLAGDNTP
jgi:hypothetical protein